MYRKLKKWIPTAIFWILFATSIGLGKRYPWLDTVWYVALLIVMLVLSVYSMIHVFRHRHETGSISYRGVPSWMRRFFVDEDYEKGGK